MAGRPPKPIKLKILNGNPGKRKLNAREPQPELGVPPCPKWLPLDAKEEWHRVVPLMERLGILTQADFAAIVAYCTAWSELEWATRELTQEGRVVYTESGYPVPHPAVAMQRSAWAAIKTFSALFGLDPSSRGRLHLPQQDEAPDRFDAYLAKRKSS